MAGEEKMRSGTSSDGADWEVVSLTASMYAAAPGPAGIGAPNESVGAEMPIGCESKDDHKNDEFDFDPMFVSKHFALSSSELESLKLDSKENEIGAVFGKEGLQSGIEERRVLSGKGIYEETCKTEPDDSLDSVRYFEKEKGLTVSDIGLGEVKALKSEILFDSPRFDVFHAETELVCEGSSPRVEGKDVHQPISDLPPPSSPIGSLSDSTSTEEHDHSVSGIPNEGLWKKQAKVLFNQAKEAKTFWSVLVAAAVVGLVIVGHRRHRAKLLVKPIEFHVSINDKSVSPMWGLVNRFRGVLVNDHQHNVPVSSSFKYGAVGAS